MPYRLRDLPAEAFASVCLTSKTFAEIIRRIGLATTSTAYRDVKRRARRENVSLDHIPKGLSTNAGKPSRNRTPLEKIMASGQRGWIKTALRRENVIPYVCAVCQLGPVWNGKLLTLRIDHINGDSSDNRLDNFRFVCPNCDSQLPTFSGRNHKRRTKCVDCSKTITPGCARCIDCDLKARAHKTKIIWPEIATLLEDVKRYGYREIGTRLGVSDKAVKKHLSKFVKAPDFRGPNRIAVSPL